jgi:hypothetical protein
MLCLSADTFRMDIMQTRLLSLVLVALTSCAGAELEASAAGTTTVSAAPASSAVSYDLFHDTLSPYGMWVRSLDYGTVWVPSAAVVGTDFVPYATAGRWAYSTAGWMFVSDWDWGWAPFHYGRWYVDAFWGWVWVPDSVWGPAWVDWRVGGGLIAWAPLPPRVHRALPRDHRTRWLVTAGADFRRPGIAGHLVAPGRRVDRMVPVRRRVRAGGTYWLAGPERRSIEVATHSAIRPIRVAPPRPGSVMRVRVEGDHARSLPVQGRARRQAAPPVAARRPDRLEHARDPGQLASPPHRRGPRERSRR